MFFPLGRSWQASRVRSDRDGPQNDRFDRGGDRGGDRGSYDDRTDNPRGAGVERNAPRGDGDDWKTVRR